jgi:outer membrane autotransporter protein
MKHGNTLSSMTRRLLVSTIATALFVPCVAYASQGQQVANGATLLLVADDYVTSGVPTLRVLNAGSMAAAGGVAVHADGAVAYGVQVDGTRSLLTFNGGSISTTGQQAAGVYVQAGGMASFGRDPAGTGTKITVSGNNAAGLYATGQASAINGVGVTISTSGVGSHGLRANGSEASLTDSDITTSNDLAYGVYADAGALANLDYVTVATQGANAHAVYFDGQLGDTVARITDGTFSTAGREAAGIYLTQGAKAQVTGTTVQTAGDFAYGVSMNQAGSQITLYGVSISTAGYTADAVWAPDNSVINASHFDIRTTGDVATGFNNRAAMITLTDGSILTQGASAHGLYASKEYASDAMIIGENLDIRTEGVGAVAAYARLGGQISLTNSRMITRNDSGYALRSVAGSSVNMTNGSILTQGQDAWGVSARTEGQLNLSQVDVLTQGVDAYASVIDGSGGRLSMDGGSLVSAQSTAFVVAGETSLNLSNGVQAIGGGGMLMNVIDPHGMVSLTMDNKVVAQGDIVFDPSMVKDSALYVLSDDDYDAVPVASTTVSLSHGSQWTGATRNVVSDLSLDNGSLWTVTSNSSVGQLALSDSRIQFASPANGGYKTLAVDGDFSGSGGVIGMHTLLNEGGPLNHQQTDRLLIVGNVTTTGTTVLDIVPHGAGASAPVDKHGVVDATDGISLVQVGGTSRADAFALRYGYVAVGPYQYKLYAFGPGQTDASQNALPVGALNWDYRLAPKYVEVPGDDHPDEPDDLPGSGDDESPDLVGPPTPVDPLQPKGALVAQMPSYIVAPIALLTYGDTLIDTLHQRLGDIRDTTTTDPLGGELFVRYIGSQQRYASSHGAYAYDFDQQINAVQLGGSLVSLTNDASSLRIGWAFDKGSTRVTPRVFDSEDASFGRYDAHGVSAWMSWQQNSGFYVDVVIGGERYQGSISTAVRGSDVARIRAGGWTASVETGYPFALGGGWQVEPQWQLKRQSLSIDPFQDADDLSTQIKVGGWTRTRAGVRFAKTDERRFSPYTRVDFTHTVGGSSNTATSSEAWGESGVFEGGRLGNTVRIGAGASSRLLPYLSLYGEADYLHDTDGYGMRGWQANVGLRLEFL